MTARAAIPQSALDRAAKAAKVQGVKATVIATDGTVYEFTPLDQKPESPQAGASRGEGNTCDKAFGT